MSNLSEDGFVDGLHKASGRRGDLDFSAVFYAEKPQEKLSTLRMNKTSVSTPPPHLTASLCKLSCLLADVLRYCMTIRERVNEHVHTTQTHTVKSIKESMHLQQANQ